MARKNKIVQKKPQKNHVQHQEDKHPEESIAIVKKSNDSVGVLIQDILIATSTGSALLAAYIATLHPSIPGGDSGELIVSANELGVAHPPGYPLFTLLSKLALISTDSGSPAWRVNMLNAIFSALAGGILQLTLLRMTGCLGTSVLGVGMFSLSKLCWTWSVSAEVFGLNNFFVALLMLLAVVFESSPGYRIQVACFGAFISGLALTNQHTIVVYVACFAIWVLSCLHMQKLLSYSTLFKLVFCVMFGLIPYAYLPMSSSMNVARWTWGDQNTFTGFMTHILRAEYGTFDLGKDQAGLGIFEGLSAYANHAMDDIFTLAIPLAVLAVVFRVRKKYEGMDVVSVFALMMVIYVTFFAWRANLDISNPLFKGVVERFWMQSDIVLAFLATLGLHRFIIFLAELITGCGRDMIVQFVMFVAAAWVVTMQLKNYEPCDQSRNIVSYNFAQGILQTIPQNALILTKGDLPTNTIRYLHLVENKRQDLTILDQEVLSYPWFIPKVGQFYPRVEFPGDFWHLQNALWPNGKKSFTFKKFLDTNFDRFPGVYVCIGMHERDPSWQGFYHLRPHGVCHKVVRASSPLDPYAYVQEISNLPDDWKEPYSKFENTSWEKVANNEMWNARINAGFYLYQEATIMEDVVAQGHMYVNSYKVYKSAIRKFKKRGIPSYWHKNFALVCEKLLHVSHDMDKMLLAKESIQHFKTYNDLEPEDIDHDNIIQAIRTVMQHKELLEKLDDTDKTVERMTERQKKMGL